jgi:hypothetical protein
MAVIDERLYYGSAEDRKWMPSAAKGERASEAN